MNTKFMTKLGKRFMIEGSIGVLTTTLLVVMKVFLTEGKDGLKGMVPEDYIK